jgi:hypothetical protein
MAMAGMAAQLAARGGGMMPSQLKATVRKKEPVAIKEESEDDDVQPMVKPSQVKAAAKAAPKPAAKPGPKPAAKPAAKPTKQLDKRPSLGESSS